MISKIKNKYWYLSNFWREIKRINKYELFAYLRRKKRVISDEEHLLAAMKWLEKAHLMVDENGFSRAYSLVHGWERPYPETTGYIIPTLLNYALFSGENKYISYAIKSGDWESKIQMKNGAVMGGCYGDKPIPQIFNTGQVIFGWLALYKLTNDIKYLVSAEKSGDFLCKNISKNGAFVISNNKYTKSGVATYNIRTAWALALLSKSTNNPLYWEAALKNVEFVIQQQNKAGWFNNNDLDFHEKPLLHTIAYTARGLLELASLFNRNDWLEKILKTINKLIKLQEKHGILHGRYNYKWDPVVRYKCLTGIAQTAIIWLKCYHLVGDERYLTAAKNSIDYLKTTQFLDKSFENIYGGIVGSNPIWAEYGRFLVLNWATKFFVDALLLLIETSDRKTYTIYEG